MAEHNVRISSFFSKHIVQQSTTCIVPAKAKVHLKLREILHKAGEAMTLCQGKCWQRVLGWPRNRYCDKRGTLSHGLASISSELRDKHISSTLKFNLRTTRHFEVNKSSLGFAFWHTNKQITGVKRAFGKRIKVKIERHNFQTCLANHRVHNLIYPCQHAVFRICVLNKQLSRKPQSVFMTCFFFF